VRLAVTVDTEADRQWEPGVPIETMNARYWQPFQDLCLRHGATPTYLCASEIVEDERARDLLGDWWARGEAEVGAHLHPWTTPPYADRPGLRYNDPVHAFPCQLPDELLAAKTETLTRQITDAFGRRPTSYRAGRFGFDLRLARLLAEGGYTVDSSVTPLWSWRKWRGLDGRGGPDFRRHTPYPSWLGTGDGAGLLEIPVTLFATYPALRRWPALLEAYRCMPVRAVRRLLVARWFSPQPIWLTPDPRYSPEDLEAAWDCASDAKLDVAVMILHSSELMPGGSPFRPDKTSVTDLLTSLDRFFAYVTAHGDGFGTLSELAADIPAGRLGRTLPA
jgi:hypothetical protein